MVEENGEHDLWWLCGGLCLGWRYVILGSLDVSHVHSLRLLDWLRW